MSSGIPCHAWIWWECLDQQVLSLYFELAFSCCQRKMDPATQHSPAKSLDRPSHLAMPSPNLTARWVDEQIAQIAAFKALRAINLFKLYLMHWESNSLSASRFSILVRANQWHQQSMWLNRSRHSNISSIFRRVFRGLSSYRTVAEYLLNGHFLYIGSSTQLSEVHSIYRSAPGGQIGLNVIWAWVL